MKLRDGIRSLLKRAAPVDEEFYLVGREARRRAGRKAGVLRGSRAHVSRMADRRKAPPSLLTHLAVQGPDGTIVRVWHPDYLRKLEEARSAHAVSDAGEGRRR